MPHRGDLDQRKMIDCIRREGVEWGAQQRQRNRLWGIAAATSFEESESGEKPAKLLSGRYVPKGTPHHPVLALDYEQTHDAATGEKAWYHYNEWLTDYRCIACGKDVVPLDDNGDPVFLTPLVPGSMGAYPSYLCADCWAEYHLPSGKKYLAKEREALWPGWLNQNYRDEAARRQRLSRTGTPSTKDNWLLRLLYAWSIPGEDARSLFDQRLADRPDRLALLYYLLAGQTNADIARTLEVSQARVSQLLAALRPEVERLLWDWRLGYQGATNVLVWQGALLLRQMPDGSVLYLPDCLSVVPALHVGFTPQPPEPPGMVPVSYFFWPPDNLGIVLNAKLATRQQEHPAVSYLVQRYRGVMFLPPHRLLSRPHPHKWSTVELAAWQATGQDLLPPVPQLVWLRDRKPSRLSDFSTPDWYSRYLPATTP